MTKTGITTHVLDLATGLPAPGIALALWRGPTQIAQVTTDADGRAAFNHAPQSGEYRLVFGVEPYFNARQIAAFYPRVEIIFVVPAAPSPHYHVPLLLSPFGYSTYRGS